MLSAQTLGYNRIILIDDFNTNILAYSMTEIRLIFTLSTLLDFCFINKISHFLNFDHHEHLYFGAIIYYSYHTIIESENYKERKRVNTETSRI